jgi:very-short-patch-repair endonuclease
MPPAGFGTSAGDRLGALGGVATRTQLLSLMSRSQLDRAVNSGESLRTARNRYALTSLDDAVRTAHAVSGVLCLASAALHHGWAVKLPPEKPHVAFRRNRKLTDVQRAEVEVHRHELHHDDVVDGVATSKELTLLQCLRSLPEDEALTIADSAARAGELSLLQRIAAQAQGRGAAKVRRIAAAAHPDAANAFESVLRSIANQVDGLKVVPQRVITTVKPWARPDLLDEDLRIVLEADSFEWHGNRAALRRDARRYDVLIVDGWIVLRFAWEDVMFDQDFVRRVISGAVRLAHRRTKAVCERCGGA